MTDEANYRQLLRDLQQLAADPLRPAARGYWQGVHEMVAAHRGTSGSPCSGPGCDDAWPCGAVIGAMNDVANGSRGY